MRDGYGFMPDNLRNIIEECGVNLSQIERETGVPRSVLSRCLNGHTELCLKNAVLLADYFDVSVDYIIGRRGRFENSEPKQPTYAERKGLTRQLDDTANQIEIAMFEMKKLKKELDEMEKQIGLFKLVNN